MQAIVRKQLGVRAYSAASKKPNAFEEAVVEGRKGPVVALVLAVAGAVVGFNAYRASDKTKGIRGIYSRDRNI